MHPGGHGLEWTAYASGAGLTLAYKFARYLYEDRKRWMERHDADSTGALRDIGKPWRPKRAILEWLFAGTTANGASWIATIGVVWIAGAAYINRLEWVLSETFASIPVHVSIAFFLGSVMEMVAPAALKWLVSKLPLPAEWSQS
jgi:hypothetical protein